MSTTDRLLFLNASTVASAVSSRLGRLSNASGYVTTAEALAAATDDLSTATAVVANTSASSAAAAAAKAASVGEVNDCSAPNEELYPSYFGIQLAVPEWEALLTAVVLSCIIVATIVGNILVILSVFTYKPLRIVQNFFIVSLAVADLTVALLVLPLNVAYSILGRWEFGIHLCKMWLTCDVMCCTSSILNLCAIALDRYWAITDPINYAQKRTVGRVLLLITGVWVLSLVISSPPLVGWNDWPEEFTSATPCQLTTNRGYVIYSSLGSFVIPLVIMTIVYIEIYIATRRRLRERAQASKINTIALKLTDAEVAAASAGGTSGKERVFGFIGGATGGGGGGGGGGVLCCCKESSQSTASMIQNDQDSISSETHVPNEAAATQQLEHRLVVVTQLKKSRRAKIKDSIKHGKARGRKSATVATDPTAQTAHTKHGGDTAGAGAEQLLLPPPGAANSDGRQDSNEISTGSGSDQKNACIEVCEITVPAGDDGVGAAGLDDDKSSLKVTPPQSSGGAMSTQAMPLQKKPSGVYQFIEEKQKISLSKERRAARTLGIIMGVFVICWLPFFLMYVILPFCKSCCPTNKFKNFITWLGYINSGLNPVIYTIFNLDYRRAFKRLLGIK